MDDWGVIRHIYGNHHMIRLLLDVILILKDDYGIYVVLQPTI